MTRSALPCSSVNGVASAESCTLIGREVFEDRVGDHERAGQADGVCEGDAELTCLDGQTRGGQPTHRPAGEHHAVGVVGAFTGEPHGIQQIGATPVRGVGIPVRRDDSQTVARDQFCERPNRGARIGLLAVPQQNRGLGGITENVRPTTGGVFDLPHKWWMDP